MKALLIMTGGTIGSRLNGGTISANKAGSLRLLEGCSASDFDVIEPLCMLSENMRAETLQALIRAVASVDFSRYDGIILAHGTDTLSYTAALLGLTFPSIPIPLILIAADYPLDDERSNGRKNFSAALSFIKERIRGVFVAYANPTENAFIYLATRLSEAAPYTGRFSDFSGTPLFEIADNKAHYLDSPPNPTIPKLVSEKRAYFDGKTLTLSRKILMLRQYPDMRFDAFDPSEYAAVLLCLYHSGTACVEGGDTSVLRFAEKCEKLNIPLYAVSARQGQQYDTAEKMLSRGIIPLASTSFEAAYGKLLLSFNQGITPPENVYFEKVGE